MKIGIVTGASSGLGKEFVKQMEDLYVNLDEIWVVARRAESMEELERELHTPIRIFAVDLTKKRSFEIIKDILDKEQPDIRMLINAAGYGKIGAVENLDTQEQLGMIELNCKSLTHMALLCIPFMGLGSRLINIASAAAFCPQYEFGVYAASKSYVLSFSRCLSGELTSKGIFVTAVCPGPVNTEFFTIAGDSKGLSNIKKLSMAEPQKVVRKALIDSVRGKEISVYGKWMKGALILTKVLPHSFITHVMKQM